MLSFRPWILGAAFAVLTVLASPLRGFAQDQLPEDVARARSQFEAGVAAARGDHWEEARRAFEESYRLSPRPATLLNLAGAQAHTSHLVEAARNYRAFLAAADGVDAQVRQQAETALHTVEQRIGRVQITLEGVLDTDVVMIDGRVPPRAVLASELPIEPGEHTATVSRDGQQLAEQAFDVGAGDLAAVTLHIERRLPPPARHVDEDFRCATINPDRETDCPEFYGHRSGNIVESPWFWVGVGVVTVAVVVVVVVATSSGGPDPYQGNVMPGAIQF